MTRPDRLAAQLKTASTSHSEEIKEISNVLKSLNKTLNELSDKHTEAGRTLEELHRKNEDVRTTLGEIKQDNAEVLKNLTQHTQQIAALEEQNTKLFEQVRLLTEQVTQQDQYSRKDIVIMTGLSYDEGESPDELARSVINVLNRISGNSLNLTKRDFIAIHRNRIDKNSPRPPTVTIKFIRFSDKDAMFTKNAFLLRKNAFPQIRLHHGLCPGLIEERNNISKLDIVKFCRYEGANRHFTVCVSIEGQPDKFYNRIRNLKHFKTAVNQN